MPEARTVWTPRPSTPCDVCGAPAVVLVMIIDPTAWGQATETHSTCLQVESGRCVDCLRHTAAILAEDAAGVFPCTLLRTLIVTPLAVTQAISEATDTITAGQSAVRRSR